MKYLLISVIALLVSGCNLDASITDLNKSIVNPVIFEKSTGAELNAGARPRLITGGNYSVSYSVGNVSGDIKVNTTRGYKVFSSVQGNVFSED